MGTGLGILQGAGLGIGQVKQDFDQEYKQYQMGTVLGTGLGTVLKLDWEEDL